METNMTPNVAKMLVAMTKFFRRAPLAETP